MVVLTGNGSSAATEGGNAMGAGAVAAGERGDRVTTCAIRGSLEAVGPFTRSARGPSTRSPGIRTARTLCDASLVDPPEVVRVGGDHLLGPYVDRGHRGPVRDVHRQQEHALGRDGRQIDREQARPGGKTARVAVTEPHVPCTTSACAP